MPDINIKPTHKPIQEYYTELEKYAQLGEKVEKMNSPKTKPHSSTTTS